MRAGVSGVPLGLAILAEQWLAYRRAAARANRDNTGQNEEEADMYNATAPMPRYIMWAFAISLTATIGTASAIYNTPAKAKGIKTDLVVAYQCTAPNATQFFVGAGIISACTPPFPTTNSNPANVTTFGPKGKATIKVGVANGDIKVGIKALDLLNNGMAANGINLGAKADRVIATSGTCAPGLPPQPAPLPGTECTSTDISPLFSALLSIPCTSGKCQLKTTVNTIVPGAISVGSLANTEIGGIGLTDPDGDVAFTSGLFIP